LGALTDAGVPEHEAEVYAEGVRRGGTLIIVSGVSDADWNATDILRRHGAVDNEQRRVDWQNQSPAQSERREQREPAIASTATLERPAATPSRIPDKTEWDDECSSHYQQTLAGSGRTYEEMRPAYEYGFHAASDPRFSGDDWGTTEANVRQDWSTRGHGLWEEVKDAVRCGWACGKNRARAGSSRIEGFTGSRNMENPIERAEESVTGDQFDSTSGKQI
jgi:hypothetical protein